MSDYYHGLTYDEAPVSYLPGWVALHRSTSGGNLFDFRKIDGTASFRVFWSGNWEKGGYTADGGGIGVGRGKGDGELRKESSKAKVKPRERFATVREAALRWVERFDNDWKGTPIAENIAVAILANGTMTSSRYVLFESEPGKVIYACYSDNRGRPQLVPGWVTEVDVEEGADPFDVIAKDWVGNGEIGSYDRDAEPGKRGHLYNWVGPWSMRTPR